MSHFASNMTLTDRLVQQLIESQSSSNDKIQCENRINRVTLKIDVSHTDHSHVIGKGGRSIKAVMTDTQCHIHFPDSNRTNLVEKSNQVSISGQPEGVERARQRLREMLPIIFSFDLPFVPSGFLDVYTNPILQQIQRLYEVQICYKQKTTKILNGTSVCVKGTVERAKQTKEAALLVLEHHYGQYAVSVPVSLSIEVDPKHHAFLLNQGNHVNFIKHILHTTGATVHFPDNSSSGSYGSLSGFTPNFQSSSDSLESRQLTGQPIITSIAPPQPKKSTVLITGTVESVFAGRQSIINRLPVILMFDVTPEECAKLEMVDLSFLNDKHDVSISIKPKAKQQVKSIIIKATESNVLSVYRVRQILLNLGRTTEHPSGPLSYTLPQCRLGGQMLRPTEENQLAMMQNASLASASGAPSPAIRQSSYPAYLQARQALTATLFPQLLNGQRTPTNFPHSLPQSTPVSSNGSLLMLAPPAHKLVLPPTQRQLVSDPSTRIQSSYSLTSQSNHQQQQAARLTSLSNYFACQSLPLTSAPQLLAQPTFVNSPPPINGLKRTKSSGSDMDIDVTNPSPSDHVNRGSPLPTASSPWTFDGRSASTASSSSVGSFEQHCPLQLQTSINIFPIQPANMMGSTDDLSSHAMYSVKLEPTSTNYSAGSAGSISGRASSSGVESDSEAATPINETLVPNIDPQNTEACDRRAPGAEYSAKQRELRQRGESGNRFNGENWKEERWVTSGSHQRDRLDVTTNLSDFLVGLGLGKYADTLAQHEVDMETFLTLSENELRELGINTFGARRKMLLAIQEWQHRG